MSIGWEGGQRRVVSKARPSPSFLYCVALWQHAIIRGSSLALKSCPPPWCLLADLSRSLVLEDLARGVASEELVQRLVRCLPGLKQLRLRRCADLGESWAQRLSTTLRRSRLQVEFVPAPASAAVGVP